MKIDLRLHGFWRRQGFLYNFNVKFKLTLLSKVKFTEATKVQKNKKFYLHFNIFQLMVMHSNFFATKSFHENFVWSIRAEIFFITD